MAGANPALLGAGAIALLLMARNRGGSESKNDHPAWDGQTNGNGLTNEERLSKSESPEGRPFLGKLYQVQQGDNHLSVARRALFGSSEPRLDPVERQAVIDLSIRMDCSPWNQTVYGVPKSKLSAGHYAAEKGYSDKGIWYMPAYPNNRERMKAGMAPLVGEGNSFPYIWIPMIDLDVFMATGEVTTLGQNWPDEDGEGEYSMINPPPWVLDLNFEGDLQAGVVGCELPEGDFRQTLEFEE